MFKIEYDVKLNESGRPCIDLSEDYEDKQEDKFFAIELARYFLQNVYHRRSKEFDEHTSEVLDSTICLLGQIGDEMAEILYGSMKAMGEIDYLINKPYNFSVHLLEELDEIGEYTAMNGKLFKKEDGLKVFVFENKSIYELINNIWEEK